ncbi:hypothetical protein C7974DRAFT_424274 [Boeremia exigua]|uniref:uncharacterized protein n=1 Tax=Boeremia exigua TaxID=749465 RepID=UPI001E8CFACF|nr:uncharacterized protein C7974DRAFT_424274 [Boeremia exigua]KAH6629187.1 hypothetical protein C7974DRAFT_424274 [Boeremia exigua]
MPLRADLPIVRVEHGSMHTIETRNPENLFGLWSVFSKCSPAMEDGKRYENMAWRLWARETFCCQPDPVVPPQWSFDQALAASAPDVPELSTSVASDDSLDPLTTSQHRSDSSASRPDLRRHDSATSNARGKHMTPIDLEKVVNSIQEKRAIEPLSPLPPQLSAQATDARRIAAAEAAAAALSASPPMTARRCAPDLSTSTFATTRGSDDMSAAGSDVSTSTDMSQHSVVRGFEPGLISTSMRSSTNLATTPSILKKTSSFIVKPLPCKAEPMTKKKQPVFTLGGSSDEDASSFEAYSMVQRSSLSENLRKAGSMKKTTSFANQISLRQYQEAISESEGAIESDSDEPDESAIEEEDSGDDWEDDDEEAADESHQSSMQTTAMFPRVDSKPNLTSHRSLLTTMMHEGDRAQAMQNAAQRQRQQPPQIRRSRTTTPNGPSIGNSPQEDSGLMMRQQASRAKPIIMTTSNVHPPALSPRTTRRLMLQNELSGSLRQNLLWERQQKNATTNAAMRRAATTTDLQGMATKIQPQPMHTSAKNPNSYFDQGLGSYHTKGW